MSTETDETKRGEAIQSLRDFANFLEAHPTAALPGRTYSLEYCSTPEEMVERVKVLGGKWVKDGDERSDYFGLERHFGEHYNSLNRPAYRVIADRKRVCKKVTKMMPVEVWECPDSLLADGIVADEPAPDHSFEESLGDGRR